MERVHEVSMKKPQHVLVVDDTELIRVMLSDMLNALGCTVAVFSSGEAVLAHVAEDADFDLILMDCQMPQMDGLEATRRLLKHHSDRSIQVVAISAHCTEADRLQQIDAGMTEHLNKPFRLAELKALVDRLG